MSKLSPYTIFEARVRELEAELALMRQERDAARLRLSRIHRVATTAAALKRQIVALRWHLHEIAGIADRDAVLADTDSRSAENSKARRGPPLPPTALRSSVEAEEGGRLLESLIRP